MLAGDSITKSLLAPTCPAQQGSLPSAIAAEVCCLSFGFPKRHILEQFDFMHNIVASALQARHLIRLHDRQHLRLPVVRRFSLKGARSIVAVQTLAVVIRRIEPKGGR